MFTSLSDDYDPIALAAEAIEFHRTLYKTDPTKISIGYGDYQLICEKRVGMTQEIGEKYVMYFFGIPLEIRDEEWGIYVE